MMINEPADLFFKGLEKYRTAPEIGRLGAKIKMNADSPRRQELTTVIELTLREMGREYHDCIDCIVPLFIAAGRFDIRTMNQLRSAVAADISAVLDSVTITQKTRRGDKVPPGPNNLSLRGTANRRHRQIRWS